MFPNLTTLALLWVAGSLIFIPLMIIAVRLAVVPLLETISRPRAATIAGAAEERIVRLEQRVGQRSRELERMAAGGAPHTEP